MLTFARAFMLIAATGAVAGHAWRVPVRVRLRGERDAPAASRPVIAGLAARLEPALQSAGLAIAPYDAVIIWSAVAGALTIVAAAIAPVLAVIVVAAAIAAVPAGLNALKRRSQRSRAAALPSVLDDVAHHLRGGGTVVAALDALGRGHHLLAADCRTIVARSRAGLTLSDAIAQWADECGIARAHALAGALVVAVTTGGQAATALDGMAAGLRDELAVAAEAHALSAQARLSAVVVALAPVGFLAFSALGGGASLRFLTTTAAGRMCLGLGIALDVLAARWMQRIVAVEP